MTSAPPDPRATSTPDASASDPRHALRYGLTLPELWAFLAIALPILASLIAAMSTVDLAYAVRAGREILGSGRIPAADTFTFSVAGQPWVDQQWLAQVVLGRLFDLGGWPLLAAVRAALVGFLFASVLAACRFAGAGLRAAAWLTLASFGVSLVALALRPQLLGMVLFALTLLLLAARWKHERWPWAIPVVVTLWANLHGSFFLGPLAVGFAWLEDVVGRRRGARGLFAVAILSVAATLLGPWGASVWTYAISLSVSPIIRTLLVEWQPTSPLTFAGAVFALSLVGTVAAVVVAARRDGWRLLPWPTLLWLGLLAAIGAYAQRGVAWWAIGAPSAVASLLFEGGNESAERGSPLPSVVLSRSSRGRGPFRRSPINLVIAILIFAAGLLTLPWWRANPPNAGSLPLLTDAPVGITEAVRSAASTGSRRLFAPQDLGSWFELAAPSAPVFVDSRVELFPASVWEDYLGVVSGAPSASDILDRRQVDLVVLRRPTGDRVRGLLEGTGRWREIYSDAEFWLLGSTR